MEVMLQSNSTEKEIHGGIHLSGRPYARSPAVSGR